MANMLLYLIIITIVLFVIILIAYLILKNRLSKNDMIHIKKLREGTKEKKFTADIIYQKLYIYYKKIPILKRYLKKLRRRLEIIHVDDEYLTRRQVSKIITNSLLIIFPLTLAIILATQGNMLLLSILLLFEVFLIETFMTGMVDKLDTKLLKQQIDFFAEIRHAYHEFNMVEEAIYEVSQNDELEVSRQGEKIYEILISDDPETELEKYYDIAPNSYLKEFAGISYLTREFGDREIDGASLYLKNLNNITEEMQLEILKRDKLDYVFQSLSVIAILPVLLLQPLRNWAVSNFAFTSTFYDGKGGFIVQILLILVTILSYVLTRKIKDSGAIKDEYVNPDNVWQMKIYKTKIGKKIVDLFIPKQKTKEYRRIVELMKDAATKQKMETLYVNRLATCILVFVISLMGFMYLHKIAIDYVYNEPTGEYDLLGEMSEADKVSAMQLTKQDNYFLDRFRGNTAITEDQLAEQIAYSEYYKDATEEQIAEAAARIYKKLQIINAEYLKWFELLLAFALSLLGYMGPKWMLMFQKILRQLEIENEIMQFQTIILMLMKIERVNVEIILEWLERYANIFKEQITKCVNNYEAGAWEALEVLRNEISAQQLIRIVESLQAAVEQIPIEKAFDELDNEREYYQEKRKASNDKLIARKGLIGKVVGFTPLVGTFVGYLIAPLIIIGLMSMTSAFSTMSTML